tara:strand:+ start:3209 stop:4267 length:1059 start_codon:yes stop_codon:yes gene_type:complete
LLKEIKNINKFLFDERLSIGQFLIKVKFDSNDFFLIINSKKRIRGIITLGDFKRNFFPGINVDRPIKDICNQKYIYLSSKSKKNKKEIINLFIKNKIKYIPILDNKTPIKILTYTENKKIIDIPVIINAGGKGKRLADLSKNTPKPLIKVSNKPLIHHIINTFYEHGFLKFYFGLNYKKQIIQKSIQSFNLKINKSYIIEKKPLGTAGILSIINNLKCKNFIFSNCDTIINFDYNEILDFHKVNKIDLTIICSYQNIDINYGVCNVYKNGNVKSISEKPKLNFLVNTGVYVCNSKILNKIKKNTYLDFDELIERLIKNKFKVKIFPIHSSKWLDFGTIENFYHADSIISNLK